MSPHFHTIGANPGLNTLANHSCNHLGFSRLLLHPLQTYRGATPGDREALLVVLSGTARINVNGREFPLVGARHNVFEKSPHSVYLPRGASYWVEPLTLFDAALPSAPSNLDLDAYEICPEQVHTGQWGTQNYTRTFRKILVESGIHPACSLIVGETLTPPGNLSTYPPHQYEEMHYFRMAAAQERGFLRHHSRTGEFDETHAVQDNTLASMPFGHHSYAGAPGSQSYYLWFLAGRHQQQDIRSDPSLAWTQQSSTSELACMA